MSEYCNCLKHKVSWDCPRHGLGLREGSREGQETYPNRRAPAAPLAERSRRFVFGLAAVRRLPGTEELQEKIKKAH
jgi:hypothetical protein